MSSRETVTSQGNLLVSDDSISIPQEANFNPLAIFNEANEILLLVTPSGDVQIRNQEGLRVWAAKTAELMNKLAQPPQPEPDTPDFIMHSDPGDEADD